ncbi:MAG TPA: CidA/LrgA family protein [Steroidobacteraceae bacterium]|nr:CidA/LrgA family protein [Steroidobacteraceae bacterium]
MKWRTDLTCLAQIGLILLFWLAGSLLVRLLRLPFPASLPGLALLLLALAAGWLPPRGIARGANWLLARMLVFFVPAVLAVLDHPEFAGALGLKILLVIVAGTLAVMGVTLAVVRLVHREG